MKTTHLLAISIALVCSPMSQGAASSVFDDNNENWTAVGDTGCVGATFQDTGGNPGGTVAIDDLATGGIWYWLAPEKYQGDQSNTYGAKFKFDLKQVIGGAPDPLDREDLIIEGGGVTIIYDLPTNPATNGDWTSFEVTLDETAPWKIDDLSGVQATQVEIQTVLSNVTSLRIRGEYQFGPDTGFLDNVFFGLRTTATAPTTGIALYAGITIDGSIGVIYSIESSEDMITWDTLKTVLLTENPLVFIDLESANEPRRFYRALPLP